MATNVKVYAKKISNNASREEKDKNFKQLLSNFKRQVKENGIIDLWQEKQFYKSKSEKKKETIKKASRKYIFTRNN